MCPPWLARIHCILLTVSWTAPGLLPLPHVAAGLPPTPTTTTSRWCWPAPIIGINCIDSPTSGVAASSPSRPHLENNGKVVSTGGSLPAINYHAQPLSLLILLTSLFTFQRAVWNNCDAITGGAGKFANIKSQLKLKNHLVTKLECHSCSFSLLNNQFIW